MKIEKQLFGGFVQSIFVSFRYILGCGAVQKFPKIKSLPLSIPRVDKQKCTGCQLCAKNCPCHAIKVQSDNNQIVFSLEKNKCVLCGLCVDVCPKKALNMNEKGE